MTDLTISIERLVLDGFDAPQGRRLLAALRRALAAEGGGDISADMLRLRSQQPLRLRPGAQPEEIGRALARALVGRETP
jgi:hypothetical protein